MINPPAGTVRTRTKTEIARRDCRLAVMRLLLTVEAIASSVSFAAPTPSEEGGLEAPWVASTLNAQRQTCVYDVCPRVLVEGAGTSVVNGVYYPDPRRSCDDDAYGTPTRWAGYINGAKAAKLKHGGATLDFGPGSSGGGWEEGWQLMSGSGKHIRYYYPAEPGSTIPSSKTWLQRTGGGNGGDSPSPTVTCISAVSVFWSVITNPTSTFDTTVAQSYNEEKTRTAELSLSVGASYSGVEASASYTRSVARTVRKGMTNTRVESCANPCGTEHKLYVQQYSAGSIVATPACGLVTCVPNSFDNLKPACPIEFCGGNLWDGCQCCSSLDFLKDHSISDPPPLCPGSSKPNWVQPMSTYVYSAPVNPSPSQVLSACGAANSRGHAITSLKECRAAWLARGVVLTGAKEGSWSGRTPEEYPNYWVPSGCAINTNGFVHFNKATNGLGGSGYDLLCKPCIYDVCPRIMVQGAGQSEINGIYSPDPRRSCDEASYATSASWKGYVNERNAYFGFGGGHKDDDWMEGWHLESGNDNHIRYYHPAEPGSTVIPEGPWLQRSGGGNGGSLPNPTVKCIGAVDVGWTLVSTNPTAAFQTTATDEIETTDEEAIEAALSVGASYSGVSASSSYTTTVTQKVVSGLSREETVTCDNPCNGNRSLWVQDYGTVSSAITPECSSVTCAPYGAVPQCPVDKCGGSLTVDGCQCCTSLDFIDGPTRTYLTALGQLPPLC